MPHITIQLLRDKAGKLVSDGPAIETAAQWIPGRSKDAVTMRVPVGIAAKLPIAGQIDIAEQGHPEIRRYDVGVQQQTWDGPEADVELFLIAGSCS